MDEAHQRIILPDLNPEEKELTLRDEEYHYLRNVLRLKPGEPVTVLDGSGWELKTMIKEIKKKEITLEVLSRFHHERPGRPSLTLLQAVLKGDRMDLVIQKTTELGVDVIVPVFTEHSVVKTTKRLSHWKRVCLEATRQSRRIFMPEIKSPCPFNDAIKETPCLHKYILYERAENPLRELLSREIEGDVAVAVGPEGGFSKDEIKKAQSSGFEPICISENILRAETASIAIVSLLKLQCVRK